MRVDRHRAQRETHRAQQVEEPGEARVFDGDHVAGPELRRQGALDPVEGAADHGDVLGGDPGLAELGRASSSS